MADLSDIHRRQASSMDSLLAAFEEHLRALIARAQVRVIGVLQKRLSITDGVIDQTPGNLRILRTLNGIFAKELDAAGLPQLVEAFIGEFRGQLSFLHETLDHLSSAMKTPLPAVNWTAADTSLLASFQASAASSIESVVETAAASAMTRSLFSVGGLKFGDLVQTLAEKYEASIARARTLADTGMTVFYRTATDRAFQQIEADLPETKIRYRYSGPDDLLTRPFCEQLLEADKAYTREQIDRMNNHQIPNVFLSGGGWNCRHQWILDVRGLMQAKAA